MPICNITFPLDFKNLFCNRGPVLPLAPPSPYRVTYAYRISIGAAKMTEITKHLECDAMCIYILLWCEKLLIDQLKYITYAIFYLDRI